MCMDFFKLSFVTVLSWYVNKKHLRNVNSHWRTADKEASYILGARELTDTLTFYKLSRKGTEMYRTLIELDPTLLEIDAGIGHTLYHTRICSKTDQYFSSYQYASWSQEQFVIICLLNGNVSRDNVLCVVFIFLLERFRLKFFSRS